MSASMQHVDKYKSFGDLLREDFAETVRHTGSHVNDVDSW